MQITFDTTTLTDDEVRGIFALLDTVRPAAFDPSPEEDVRVLEAVADKLSAAGISISQDENGRTITTVSADQFVLPESAGEPFTMEKGVLIPETAEAAAVIGAPTPPTTDSTGLPWDERIHASSKALNADGTWRTKRGVDKALVAQVEAELRSRTTVTQEITETGVDEEGFVTIEPVGEPVVTVAPPAPPAPEAPLAPAPTPAAPSPEPAAPVPAPPAATSPFVALMKRVTTAQGAGKLTQPRVKELLESLDKKSIMDLRTDEDALASFAVLLDGEGV